MDDFTDQASISDAAFDKRKLRLEKASLGKNGSTFNH